MINKLILAGHVHNRPHHRVSSYHSWPLGTTRKTVDKLIDGYKKAFVKVSVRIEYALDDDNYPY